jgi:alpha-tubulin suppressor-like RCC1 family protein
MACFAGIGAPARAQQPSVGLEFRGTIGVGETAHSSAPFRHIAAGFSTSGGIRTDGTIAEWGAGIQVPVSANEYTELRIGDGFTVAIKLDSTVARWGRESSGQLDVPAGLTQVIQVAAGSSHVLALRADGTVVAWGANWAGQSKVPTGLRDVVQVEAGFAHSLALRRDGTVVAWGYNQNGQCNVPVGLTDVVSIAAGRYHTLALKSDGTVVGWGMNDSQQCTPPQSLGNVLAIVAGGNSSLALLRDGTVRGWGNNSNGQLSVPQGLTNVKEIALGYAHAAALDANGAIFAWGSDKYGECNPPINDLGQIQQLAAGGDYSLALLANGTIRAWGSNNDGELNIPPGLSDIVQIAAGGSTPIALKSDGTVVCWGSNLYGQAAVPVGLTDVAQVAGGISHSVALRKDGTVVCWGSNNRGECNVPSGLSNVVQVAAGWQDTMALKDDGTVVCWGINAAGENNPPAGMTGITKIAAGYFYSLALGPFGKVYAWGDNRTGQCDVPAGPYYDIAAGGYHAAGLRLSTPHILMWGNRYYGQCDLPAAVDSVKRIALGDSHTILQRADGLVLGFGLDWDGQTRIPRSSEHLVKVAVTDRNYVGIRQDGTVVAGGATADSAVKVPGGITNATQVASGSAYSMALADGKIFMWGNSGYVWTQKIFGKVPNEVTTGYVIGIGAGATHALAIVAGNSTSKGTVYAWGTNGQGQSSPPASIGNHAVQVAGGSGFSVALKDDGTVVCWGDNSSRQCNVPPGLADVVQLACGAGHVVALKQDGTVVAWGSTADGKCDVPTGLSNVVEVAAGDDMSYARKYDGSIVAWGFDSGKSVVGSGGIAAGNSTMISIPALAISANPATGNIPDIISGQISVRSFNPIEGDIALTGSSPNVTIPTTTYLQSGESEAKFDIGGADDGKSSPTSFLIAKHDGYTSGPTARSVILSSNLATLTPSATSVVGGSATPLYLILNLNRKASFDRTIALSSSDPTIYVPASITIPAGSQIGYVTLDHFWIIRGKAVTITATLDGVTLKTKVSVTTLRLVGMNFSPTSASLGTNVQVKILLNAPVRSDTVMPLLCTHLDAFPVPDSVVVPAGSYAATFTSKARAVEGVTNVVVTAIYGSGTYSKGLDILWPTVKTFTWAKASISGECVAQGFLLLSRNAPTGGLPLTVTLPTGFTLVDGPLVMPSGQRNLKFRVMAPYTDKKQTVVVSVTSGTSTKGAKLGLNPNVLAFMGVNPLSVKGGADSKVTLTLRFTASADDDRTISITSSAPDIISVPSQLTVLKGVISVSLPLTVAAVSANQPVTLSASYHGVTITKAVTVRKN